METKKLVNPNLSVMFYEVEEHIMNGWRISQKNVPIFLGGSLYEVELEKGELNDIPLTKKAQEEINSALDRADTEDEEQLKESVVAEKPQEVPKRGRKPASK